MADLSNIDAEIKRINELKNRYQSLLQIEREVNQTMLYSSGVRKKYSDALSAALEIQKDIIKQERDYERSLVGNSQALNANMTTHKKLKEEHSKLLKVQEGLRKSNLRGSKQYKENKKRLKEYERSIRNTESAINDYEVAMNENIKDAEKIKNSTKGLKKVFDDLAKLDETKVSSQKDLNDLTKQRISLMRQQFSIQEKSGVLSADESKKLKEKLGQLEEMQRIQGEFIKESVSEDLAPMIDDITRQATELTDPKRFKKDKDKEIARSREAAESRMGLSLRGQQAESLKSIFSGKTSFGDKLKAIKSYKDAGKGLEQLNEAMGTTGKSALSVGGMMKLLGSSLGSLGKLGIVAIIMQAVKAVVAIAKAVNELDKFLKGFNQTFAKLHGPTVMMKDVDKSMSEFTKSIFNLQRNLKYGLKSEDIVGMFQGISESGMSLQGILKNVQGGYGKLIEESAKIHLDFGVSMEEAGSMLGEQMTDLRSSIDEASEGFKILSYDASIAGIQSQKFYQATYAAAEALSYYGNFLSSASNTLKKFQTQGAMGFKDAQKQTQELTNLFQSMDDNAKTAFIEMSGGVEAYRKDFIKLEADSKEAVSKHLTAIAEKRESLEKAKKAGNKRSVEELETQIKVEEELLKTSERIMAQAGVAAKSNAQDMATYLGLLSDKIGEKMAEYFKKNGPNVFTSGTRAVKEHMKGVLHVSDEFAMMMIGTIQASRTGIEQMAKDLQGLVDKLPEGKDSNKFREDIGNIISIKTAEGKMDMDAIKKGLEKYEKDNGVSVAGIYDRLVEFPNAVQEFMKKGYKGVMDNIETITLDEQKNIEQVTGESAEDQKKRLDDLVQNTRTIEDFIGINRENAKYFLASNDLQKDAAKAAIWAARSTSSILTFVQGIAKSMGVGGAKTEEEFRKSEDYEALRIGLEKEMILKKEIARTPEKDTERRTELENKLKQVEGIKKGIGGMNLYQQDELVGIAEQRVNKLYEDKARIEEFETKVKSLTGGERDRLEKVLLNLKEDFKKRTYTLDIADTDKVEEEKDYKAATGGYALLSKGDVVVNAKSMSKGLSGDLGAFAGTAVSELIRSMPDTSSVGVSPQIPVNISIGSISGDPEEFLNRIKPAIEQAFERMYFEKQKRR